LLSGRREDAWRPGVIESPLEDFHIKEVLIALRCMLTCLLAFTFFLQALFTLFLNHLYVVIHVLKCRLYSFIECC